MSVPSAITASAARATSTPKATASTRVPQWQLDSLAYYDQIGAVRYSAQFAARALSKIRWFPAIRNEAGEVEESEEPALLQLWDRFQDPGGGRAMMTATFGQLDFLVGESYLLWSQADPDEEGAEETWEIVSPLELRKQGKRSGSEMWERIKAPGLTPQQLLEAEDDAYEPVGDNVRVYRWWRRHPAYSLMADAPMRSVLAECEEIVRATHSINARLISRLAGPGILAIPSDWSMKPLAQVVGEENPDEDPFQARLTEAMITAIGKPGSAESVAPIVVRVPLGPGERLSDKYALIKVWNPEEVIRELELREKALQRYAVGVDMPPEKVMGLSTSGTQHWNAWMVDEDAWGHIAPVAQSFADNAASSYLRPAAEDAGVANWQRVCVGYDPAEILSNPDGFKDAMELYRARAVGKAYLRAAGNAQDTDAPTDAELAEMLFAETHVQVEVSGGKIEVPEPAARPEITPVAPVPTQPDSPNGRPPTGEDTPRQAPPEPDGMTASAYRLLGVAEGSMEEIRARVGTRLRNHIRGKCPECFDEVRNVRPGIVAATLGPERVLEFGPDLVSLAIDGGANFTEVAIRLGVSHTQARALQEVLELHTITTIYDRAPELPAGFLGRVKALSGVAA